MAHPNRHLITLHGNTCSLTDPEGRSSPIPNTTWRKPTVLPPKRKKTAGYFPSQRIDGIRGFHPIVPQKLRPLRTTKTCERIPDTFQREYVLLVPWTVKLQLFISTGIFRRTIRWRCAQRLAQEGPLARGKNYKMGPLPVTLSHRIHGTGIFTYMKTIKINHSCR